MIWVLDHVGVLFTRETMMASVGDWLSWLMSLSWVGGWGGEVGVGVMHIIFLCQVTVAIVVDQCCR